MSRPLARFRFGLRRSNPSGSDMDKQNGGGVTAAEAWNGGSTGSASKSFTESDENGAEIPPIRAPVSDDVASVDEATSYGSGESFDSALDRMAASSVSSFRTASPVGSLSAPGVGDSNPGTPLTLGAEQEGALMHLNQLLGGGTTLDTSLLDDSDEDTFKQKIAKLAKDRNLSQNDANISRIVEALLPLVQERGVARGLPYGNGDYRGSEEELAEETAGMPVTRLGVDNYEKDATDSHDTVGTLSLSPFGPSLSGQSTGLGRSVPSLEPAPRPPHTNQADTPSSPASGVTPAHTDGNEDDHDDTVEKLQSIRQKFLRLVHRLGHSTQNVVVAQVLYRLGLTAHLRGGRSGIGRGTFTTTRASAIAEEEEAAGTEELDFTCTILMLGKSGVGKSLTLNILFDDHFAETSTFDRGTVKVQEFVGNIHGIKVRIIDTPGLLASAADQQQNERIMGLVKKFIRKSSPDVVLYLDRLDMQSRASGDLPLLRTITDTFGAAIWFNTIVVLTHSSSAPPDGPNGLPLSYEMFVAQSSHIVQQTIRQASGDARLLNPVSLVENHPACRTNRMGHRILPNGQIWKPQLLLLCFASKILAEANFLLKLQQSTTPGRPFGTQLRVPPLPILLSSLLQSRVQMRMPDDVGGEDEDSEDGSEEESDGDDYDELPPFRPLAKEEIAELNEEQKRQYCEEVADRAELFEKKQWREQVRRQRMLRKQARSRQKEEHLLASADGQEDEGGKAASVSVPMPDMALPPSFDSDNPSYRYRYLDSSSQWLVRPVLETHGWDHDAGYEGLNVENVFSVAKGVPASICGQILKDKKESNVNLECAASYNHEQGRLTMAGFDLQTVGQDLAYTFRAETQFKNFGKNKTTGGVAFTFLGDALTTGLKIEDQFVMKKILKLVINWGFNTSRGDKAYGGNLEATLRGKDYPLSQALGVMGLSVMNWHGDLAVGGNLQLQSRLWKTLMVARADLNNRGAGQITVRASSSEQAQMITLGLVPIFCSIIKNIWFHNS